MLTPSPLRRKALAPADSDTSLEGELGLETPVDTDDIFFRSPYRPTAPLKSFDAHLRSVAGPSRLGNSLVPFDDEDDWHDGHLFLSTPAASSTPAPKSAQQRAAQRARRSERPAVPLSIVSPAPASRLRTPVRHPQPRPRSTIETSSRRTLTPLAVTKTPGEGSFGRLAPLPAPKFRMPVDLDDDAEGFLGRPGNMEKLCIRERDEATDPVDVTMADGEAEEAVDVSPGGHVVKRRAKSRPVSWELKQSTSGTMQGPPIKAHKVDASSSIAFPSTSTSRTRTLSNTSTSMTSPKPRQRLSHASNVSMSSVRGRTGSSSQARSRTQPIVPPATLRPPARRVESSSSATLFFGPAIPRTSTPAKSGSRHGILDSPSSSLPHPPLFGRPQTSQRHSYAGSILSPEWSSPPTSFSPVSLPHATDDEEMGEITDEDDERMPSDMAMIADMDEEPEEMDEEDLFFGSSSFNKTARSDEGVGTDEESFGWGSAPATSSFFSINVTESTPSPRGKKGCGATMLEKKFKPRDSGISLTDEEDGVGGLAPPRSSGRGFGIGRSGSVSMMPPPLMTSTSANTVASSEDMEFFTPGFGPSQSSGWPGIVSASASDSDGPLSLLTAGHGQSDVDLFILRTLLQAQSADNVASPMTKRPPGTPQKRARVAVGPRPWQSAFASKVGFDFGPEDSDGGAGEKKAKKKPRKSLPAAFPMLGQGRRKAGTSAAREDTEDDESETSPSGRPAKDRYEGLGLGRPSAGRAGRSAWLLRRSSSGAISTTTSGSQSGEGSWPATPTAGKGAGWQLPPPRIPSHISPLKARLPSHLSPARTASSSSSSTAATASPTGSLSLVLPSAGLGHSEEARGKFERSFVEVGEVGSGEFGKVMKVRRKGSGPEQEAWAVKKSKRFEGARHRLRLREEVDILRLLSSAYADATGQPGARHPNVLAYVDSWEQDDALFIQTELCELGNFAHFLWEYGRAFPQLDEARVWKILADLSNGLRFIHAAGVLHLDLKPANIFVAGTGRFKIGDFGMASVWPRAGRPPGFEREGDKCYLAPEVLQGRYGTAADMFRWGWLVVHARRDQLTRDVPGEPWHKLRQDDFSQVDFGAASGALVGMIRGMMRAEPGLRVDAEGVWTHPIVARTRAAMDRGGLAAMGGVGGAFAASPLAPVPRGFLEEVLRGPLEEAGRAMDVRA
ncbi:hypothetical protein K488DRAFT_79848 [Vararia minispora EC-137]|uniref:Uncharacterized protein n=1 Tax=Vararia minispora EC-137 TaxID=1314806 RepID=A0ACB8QEB2_9AGAM|nr:hypothetical protein K488DRAFT_79848 [Vararia minispora EC-137]